MNTLDTCQLLLWHDGDDLLVVCSAFAAAGDDLLLLFMFTSMGHCSATISNSGMLNPDVLP